jgi:hypothetical protein
MFSTTHMHDHVWRGLPLILVKYWIFLTALSTDSSEHPPAGRPSDRDPRPGHNLLVVDAAGRSSLLPKTYGRRPCVLAASSSCNEFIGPLAKPRTYVALAGSSRQPVKQVQWWSSSSCRGRTELLLAKRRRRWVKCMVLLHRHCGEVTPTVWAILLLCPCQFYFLHVHLQLIICTVFHSPGHPTPMMLYNICGFHCISNKLSRQQIRS